MSLCEFCGQQKVILLINYVCPQGCTGPIEDHDEEASPYRTMFEDDGDVDDNAEEEVAPPTPPIGHGPLRAFPFGQRAFPFKLAEWFSESLYSTCEITAATVRPDYELFTYNRGLPLPGSTQIAQHHHTNLPRPGVCGLPMDWEFIAFSCHAEVSLDHPAVRRWAFTSSARFIFNGKVMFTQPLSGLLHETPFDLASLVKLDSEKLDSADAATVLDVVSMLAHRRGFMLPLPLHLRENLGYRLQIESDPPSLPPLAAVLREAEASLLVRVHLNGLLKKAIF